MELINLDFNSIRSIDGSKDKGFEEFICQLAKNISVPNGSKYIRNGTPDGGIECFWDLPDGAQWAWQAKYFQTSLGQSQFDQIESSLKTALNEKNKITKYFIAIPINPPASKARGKSMREKWEEHIQKWKQQYPSTEIIPWWYSDLIEILQHPRNSSLIKFWFNQNFLTNDWFLSQNNGAIRDLGPRYSPQIHVKINSSMIFEGLSNSKKIFDKYSEYLDFFLRKVQIILEKQNINPILLKELGEFKICIIDIYDNICNSNNKKPINFEPLEEKIKSFETIIFKLNAIKEKEFTPTKKESQSDKYSDFIKNIQALEYAYNEILDFSCSIAFKLYKDPFLLLTGEAGIGKSHQLAYYIEKRTAEKNKSIFLLGQKFSDLRNPRTQILEQLDLNCQFDDFLSGLNSQAEIEKSKILIIIDAINEGSGYDLWKDYIEDFIHQIRQYENLGLILSLRSTYAELFAIKTANLNEYHLDGFPKDEIDIIKPFFTYYNVKIPAFPLLNPEFQNPLFLKLFCEGLNKRGISTLQESHFIMTDIFSFYIDAINERIFGEHKELKLLNKIICDLIKLQIENELGAAFTCDTVAKISNKICNEYGIKNPWKKLIAEGLLFEENYQNKIFLRFSYERLNDFLVADYILNNKKLPSIKNAIHAFKHPYLYQGILNAIAILSPTYVKQEIFELLPYPTFSHFVRKAFLHSISWRETKNIAERKVVLDYINNIISEHEKEFFYLLITCALDQNSYFNAYKGHEYLLNLSLAERDSKWTTYICDLYTRDTKFIKNLIDWATLEEDKTNISDETIELSAIILGWFLTSQNRKLRDKSTKALVSLLQKKPSAILRILKYFDKVNDPYVIERLYAVAYGVTLRSSDLSFLHDLCQYIYREIFNKETVYPHILLRDYASGIIQYAFFKKINLDKIDIQKIYPPYQSNFPKIPRDKEINKYKVNPADRFDCQWGIKNIFDSMVVERNRNGNVNGYGDFGRYIFQSRITHFKHKYKNHYNFISDMHNIAIKRIFDLGYDAQKHGNFDNRIKDWDREIPINERIGKKYQWIALHELLAYLSDKYKITDNFWGKEEACVPFSGPWDVLTRDIDPSYIGRFYSNNIVPEIQYNAWNKNITEWLKEEDDFPDPKSIISEKNNEWLLLNGHLHWDKPKEIGISQYKSLYALLFYHIDGYFVNNKDLDRIKSWLESKNFYGRWLPEPSNINQIFIGEYSCRLDEINEDYNTNKCSFTERVETGEYEESIVPDIDEIMRNFYGKNLKDKSIKKKFKKLKTFRHPKTREVEKGSAFYTTLGDYSLSRIQDYSLEDESINIPQPCKMLFDYFELHHNEYENLLYNAKDELVCFSNKHNLYFKKDSLIEFLHKKDMSIIWTLLAEKSIPPQKKSEPNINTLSGVYSLSSAKEVVGTSKFSLSPLI